MPNINMIDDHPQSLRRSDRESTGGLVSRSGVACRRPLVGRPRLD
jgi:hypothetical protein